MTIEMTRYLRTPSLTKAERALDCRVRHDDRRQNFIFANCRLPVADDEAFERQNPHAVERGQFNLGLEREQRRHAVGGRRGVAQIAGDCGAVLHLRRPDLARRLLQGAKRRRQPRASDLGPGHGAADPPGATSRHDCQHFADARDVDDAVGQSFSDVGRIDVRSAGEHGRPRHRKRRESLGKVQRADVELPNPQTG